MIGLLIKLYLQLVNLGISDGLDYSEIRKVKFLNFTCLISCFACIVTALLVGFNRPYELLIYIFWALMLAFLIYLNHLQRINITRIVFATIWIAYTLVSTLYFGNTQFSEYYLMLNILLSFILFDSFWLSFLVFIGSSGLFLEGSLTSPEFLNPFIRFVSFFIIVAFFKSVIFEIEEVIKEKSRMVAEAENATLREIQKNIKAELSYKNQELINFAVQITQKNEFIETLNEKIKLSKSDEAKELRDIILANESITKDRKEFENHVQNIYEGFFVKLSDIYPDITSSEKRLAALLRIDLSSKEISTVLNISPKRVDMSRYRLRKKMNLDASANLTEALQSI